MNARKNRFVVMLVFVIGAFLLVACQKSEVPISDQQKNGEITATTKEHGERSAIAAAKTLEAGWKNLQKEAEQFGIRNLMLFEEDAYKTIRGRLFTNERLAVAIKTASKEGVLIGLDNEFRVSPSIVIINVKASDEEIVAFLLGDGK